jgi:uncharacterized protein YbcC (UPF0753/DUF2309 family)
MNQMTTLRPVDTMLARTEVAGLVALAARTVPPLWPLESAIAVNPLAGLEDLPFEQALRKGAARFGAATSLPLAQWRAVLHAGRIDVTRLRDAAVQRLGGLYEACAVIAPGVSTLDLLLARLVDLPIAPAPLAPAAVTPDVAFLAKWCGAFFDQGLAAMAMPHRDLGLYRAVLAMAGHDADFRALTGASGATLLLTVPRDPLAAIAEALHDLGVPPEAALDHLAGLVARMPGWAGHIRWRAEQADPDVAAAAPATMADLLALWLLIERAGALVAPPVADSAGDGAGALAAHFGLDRTALAVPAQRRLAAIAALDEGDLGHLFMIAAEWTWCHGHVPQMRASLAMPAAPRPPAAQLVFCIDVRSEPFRRALEATGAYETFGYAGFFGLPIALHGAGEARRKRLLPVLIAPQHDVVEAPVPGREAQAAAIALADARDRGAAGLFASAKQGSATAFATAEAAGPLAGLVMATRTLVPRLGARLAGMIEPCRHTALAPAPQFTLADKLGFALALFRLTGMAATTARLVVLAGHGASAVNNPYAAALDCGACGGHSGGANARILAAILNDPAVRQALRAHDLALPDTTVFVAAEHNTTTDRVMLFDTHAVPASHADDLARLTADLERAGATNRARRAAQLGRSPDDLLTGAVHWGEVRPEWGLAGNAAFIVGPRTLTQGIDLGGRAFLHSYDWRSDPAGTALATILTAPMVVAQWINCQYLFSTIDNHRYGSGDKTTQNVIGGIGVVQGNGGDLAIGLPRQSLFDDAGTPYHVPQRLMTVVLAPFDRVAAVVEAHDVLRRLFGNGWVHLVVIDPATGKARRWAREDEPTGEGRSPLSH